VKMPLHSNVTRRLSFKVTLILMSVVLLNGLFSAFFISRSTRDLFLDFVRETDIQMAVILAENLSSFYQSRGSWDGIEQVLEGAGRETPYRHFQGMMRGMGPIQGTRRPMNDPPRGEDSRFRVLLTGRDGSVLYHNLSTAVPTSIDGNLLREGAPIYSAQTAVGYVFVQSMLEPILGPRQNSLLSQIYHSIVLSTLIVAFSSLLMGVFLMRGVTGSLRYLSRAAMSVAKGQYELSFDLQRSDEIGDLYRSFTMMTAEIQAASAWKKKIIADSAHELRTPVSLLQGNIEMMLEGIYPMDEKRLTSLKNETMILKKLVEELQELADAESESYSYSMERVDFRELVEETVTVSGIHAAKKNIRIKQRLPAGSFIVYGDRHKLIQAISNVLQNAIRYSDEDGDMFIELRTEADSRFELVVEDSGPGVPEEERHKVFERFYRVDKARGRSSGGSGLGLAISKEILQRHGGSIECRDGEILSGARFVIQLPLIDNVRVNERTESSGN